MSCPVNFGPSETRTGSGCPFKLLRDHDKPWIACDMARNASRFSEGLIRASVWRDEKEELKGSLILSALELEG